MVLQKRVDYGFNGYQIPAIPKATRSARRRADRKKFEVNRMGAFDLLATVAGKLLLENETPPISDTIVKRECGVEERPLKLEPNNQGNSAGFASVVTISNSSGRFVNEDLVNEQSENEMGSFDSKLDIGPSGYKESDNCNLGRKNTLIIYEPHKTGVDTFNSEDPVLWDQKPCTQVGSDSSSKVPVCRDHVPPSSCPAIRDNVKVDRDDDENSSRCSHPATSIRSFRPVSRIGDRRIRKILASKYWKVAPKHRNDKRSYTDGDLRPTYRNRRNFYKRLQRSQMNIPFKKRKLFDSGSILKSEGGFSIERTSDSIEKAVNTDASAARISSSFAGRRSSFQSGDSHDSVKLRIKSFRVPELFVEIPDTATVGSLKRTVMEAVTTILSGGLCVGVLLQGKKVRDDDKTLLQTGICRDNQLDSLGFTLEPHASHTPSSLCNKDPPSILPCDAPEPLTRYPTDRTIDHLESSNTVIPAPHMDNLNNFIESDPISEISPTDNMAVEKSTTDSKALIAAPAMSVEALSVVPVHRKSKADILQRRIRRPFSVVEVEALVQAVEKFGTGRWRDIKLRAFNNAKHRTYVDLKDKWKTLVHTARISPQQRRGEPVPQDLLDRVLSVHSYWSRQQAKHQQLKDQPETCLLIGKKNL